MLGPGPNALPGSGAWRASLPPGRRGGGLGLEAPPAANDDEAAADITLLRSALRLTEQRGSAAARFAYGQAEEAYFDGGDARFRWWLAVTRVLDRMLAAEFGVVASEEVQPQA